MLINSIEDYKKRLIKYLDDEEKEKYEQISNIMSIKSKWWDIIEKEIYNSFKNYKLDIIDKIKIIGEFCDQYEGHDPKSEYFLSECKKGGLYHNFFKHETLNDLLKSFSNWYYYFYNVDENGNPNIDEPLPPEWFIHDTIRWRRY